MKARVLVLNQQHVLLEKRVGPNGAYIRPLGGNIEFGESGAETVGREFLEETGLHLKAIRYLGCTEEIGTIDGAGWHEICLLYQADLVEAEAYAAPSIRVQEGETRVFSAQWMAVDNLRPGADTPYEIRPASLYDWIMQAQAETLSS